MSRLEFSRKTKAARYLHAKGMCEGCGIKLTKTPHYDHDVPTGWMGGDASLENCRVLCQPCHTAKTSAEAPIKAKGDRIRDKAIGAKTSRWTIPGSRKSPWKRKMDGTVVRR
jgi:5-methylcytosine-specific restriction protein A